MTTQLTSLVVLGVLILGLSNCSRDGNAPAPAPANQAPAAFSLIGVANDASNVDLMPSFSWTAATDPDGDTVSYDLYIDSNESPTTLFAGDIAETNYQLQEPLSVVEKYYWKVIAKDNKGNSTTSKDTYSFTTRNTDSANQAPETFGLIGVSNGATDVDLMPNFSWTAATDPDGDAITYDLYIDSNENPTTLFAEDITETNYQLQERLLLTNQYYWKVVAKDNNGNTAQSDASFNFTTRNLNFPTTAITANADFSGRSSHSTAVFDNKLWVIGGYDGSSQYNDVWQSADGNTWTQATDNAAFSGRENHTTAVFDNKLWVIGGYDGNRKNDVWYSENGNTWTQATDSAAFSRRFGHSTVIFDNKLWVIGGWDDEGRKSDVWYSTDGSTWTQATGNAAFSGRENHTSAVFDNKLWVIGGRDQWIGGDIVAGRKNDVWYSENGSIWTQAIVNAEFSGRHSHTSAVFDNKLWVIGGYDGNYKNDVWYSENGSTWTQATDNANFLARFDHTSAVFNNKIWVIGGFDGSRKNDVWAMD